MMSSQQHDFLRRWDGVNVMPALLVMLIDSMIPDAARQAGKWLV